jgi:hypothetical protein
MDIEAYDVVVELLGQSHVFGEAIATRLQWWVGVSFALIATAHFAPERLHPVIATFLLAIYIAFSAHTFSNADADIRASQASVRDAKKIAEERGIQLDLLDLRSSDDPLDTQGSQWASKIFVNGLGAGTIGFVVFTSFQAYRKRRRST